MKMRALRRRCYLRLVLRRAQLRLALARLSGLGGSAPHAQDIPRRRQPSRQL